ncbi:hypothetical protein AMTR_s00088p00120260 [Amborella trichopoda]|uniref:Myb/SANT-like domain-containing protein n=1 Tax=Amborella trichopoda TaxID=13333 RepID=W1NWB5_AMBTC|nr:hypothetical protein AMTR_s00088p00120260 [Amborella trichopoda]
MVSNYGNFYDLERLKSKFKQFVSMCIEVEQLMRQPGFGWDEASRMVTAKPAPWAQFTTEFSFVKKYMGKSLPVYFNELENIFGSETGMVETEPMWKGKK